MITFWFSVRASTTNTAKEDLVDYLLVTNDECSGIKSEELAYNPSIGSSHTSMLVPEGAESVSTHDK